MKMTKRILSLALCLALCLSLALPAMASSGPYTLTIHGKTAGHTYEAYQIFSGDLVTVEGKDVLSNVVWGSAIVKTGAGAYDKSAALLAGINANSKLTVLHGATSAAMLAEKLGAEVGYSRARVMNGGVDAEKVIGISGHLLAPEVCIVVGASGAAALMAGVRNSKFVVAINHDASAAVFSQADVGVVDDWKVVLEALVTNIHADCQ